MRRFLTVLLREAAFVAADRNLVMVLLVGVSLYPLLYGTLYWNKREREAPLMVVDEDHSAASRQLVRAMDAHPMLAVYGQTVDGLAARDAVHRLEAVAIVTVPRGYGELLAQHRTAVVVAHVDAARFLAANDVNVAMNEVVAALGREARVRILEGAGLPGPQANRVADPVQEDIRALYNPGEAYGDFLIPAIFMLILLHTLLIGFAEGIGKEREANGLQSWRASAGGSVMAMVAGKGVFYVLLYGAHALFSLAVFFPLYGQRQAGAPLPLALLFALTLAAYAGWGIVWGSLFKRKITGLQVTVLTSYPVLLLSGYSWPSSAMPAWLQGAALLLPSTPFLKACARVTQMGAGVTAIGGELVHLAILCVAGFLAAAWRLRVLTRGLGAVAAVSAP